MTAIGTLNEKSLHASLKSWYLQPGDQSEVALDGYVIDILRDDLLIEIQSRSFSSIKRKLHKLTANHPVRLVYPIAQEKWLVKLPTEKGAPAVRRKSPKRGKLCHVFSELVSFPQLFSHDNFSLHIILIQEEEVVRQVPGRRWRRKGWLTEERRLLDVVAEHEFETPEDLLPLIPDALPAAFTTADLAAALKASRNFARKMAYCLDKMQLVERVGKQGNSIVYARSKVPHHN